jgi:iron complex outermembrane receptor protein
MNGRYDYYSNMKKSAFSYFVGTEINDKVKNFGLNLSYSHNFRAPSFNEMYYLNYGNTQLVPETSNSLMIGIKYLPLSFLDLYISGFYINIKNQIVSIPKNPLMWTAQNFGKVQNIGVDAQLKYSLPKNFLDLTMSYTYQQPIDKFVSSLNYNKLLPFVSEEKLNLSMNSEIRNFYFSTQIMYNSFCFSQPDNSLNSIIHSFLNFDCSIGYKFSLDISEYITNIQIKNITNKVNYIIPYYPLAGRHYILNFIWKYL